MAGEKRGLSIIIPKYLDDGTPLGDQVDTQNPRTIDEWAVVQTLKKGRQVILFRENGIVAGGIARDLNGTTRKVTRVSRL